MGINLRARIKRAANPVLNWWWSFQSSSVYWSIRNKILLVDFHIRNWIFSVTSGIEQARSTVTQTWDVVRKTAISLFFSLCLFLVLDGSEALFRKFVPTVHDLLVDWTNFGLSSINSGLDMKPDIYSAFMGGVASVAGVFLGLYFTAVSIGVGQMLGNLSPRLRHLLVTEKKGSLYIQMLTVLTGLTFLLWANSAIFNSVSYPAIIFVTIFSLFLVTAFYPLGLKSFFLADPTSIAEPVFLSIHGVLKSLRRKQSLFVHPSFETFYRDRVSNSIDVIDEIVDLALEKRSQDYGQISNIIQNVFLQMLYYLQFKSSIPSNSYWYLKRYKHDDWLIADDTKTKILDYMGTFSEPSQAPDHDWLETRVIGFYKRILNYYVKNKNGEGVIQVVALASLYVRDLSVAWQFDHAIKVYNLIETSCRPLCFDLAIESLTRLQLVERIAHIKLDIVQQSYLRIHGKSPDEEVKALTKISFEGGGYWPDKMLSTLRQPVEQLIKQIKYEKKIENKILTPAWYVNQVIASNYSTNLEGFFRLITEMPVAGVFKKEEKETFENAYVKLIFIQNEIQIILRIKNHELNYVDYSKNLKKFEKNKSEGLLINLIEHGKYTKKFDTLLDQLYDTMGELLLPVYKSVRDKNLPDYFGIAYNQLCSEIFRQIKANEHQRFEKLFQTMLASAFFARQRLLEEYSDRDTLVKVKISLEPIKDMMALSVYGAFYSELHNNEKLHEIILNSWKIVPDAFKVGGDKSVSDWLAAVYEVIKGNFRTANRDGIRYEWQNEFVDELIRRNFISDSRHYSSEKFEVPQSKLLKVYCRSGIEPFYQMDEVFMGIFLPELGASSDMLSKLDSSFFNELHEKDSDSEEIDE